MLTLSSRGDKEVKCRQNVMRGRCEDADIVFARWGGLSGNGWPAPVMETLHFVARLLYFRALLMEMVHLVARLLHLEVYIVMAGKDRPSHEWR